MNDWFRSLTGAGVIAASAAAILAGLDVRLVMLLGALLLTALAGDVTIVLKAFLNTLSDEQFVVPICTAMGFAYVLRQSGCDRHLVLLLSAPIRRLRPFLIPGALAIGCFVNIAIISQASTAVAVGTVMIPLLRSAGFCPAVVGATLLLGASIGGELLNPGAPELQSVAKHLGIASTRLQPFIAKLLAVQFAVAGSVFWWKTRGEKQPILPEESDVAPESASIVRALVPLVPLAILMMVGPPFNLFHVPDSWLVDPARGGKVASRLIGATMLFGSALTLVVSPSTIKTVARSFFEGVGYAMANIVSVIVTANCFGEGIKALHLADWVGFVAQRRPSVIWLLAGSISLFFAIICGSGMATTESLFRFFVPKDDPSDHNLAVGTLVSIAAAAGRTTSPAAAVVLLCATLLNVRPAELLRRVFVPLVLATAVTIVAAWIIFP